VKKLQLLFALNDKHDQTQLARDLFAQSAWVEEHNEGTVRVAVRNDRAREVAPVMDVPELDAVLELGLPDTAEFAVLVDRVESLLSVFQGRVDPLRSVAIVGQEHVLVSGEGPFQLFRCFGKRNDISLQRFKDHFLNIHSQFGVGLPGRPPYRQLHRDEAATARLRELTGFTNQPIDGIAQLMFYGPEAMSSLGGDPERAKATSDDGALFIDADTRRTSVAAVILTGGPID
jgi:hypothetical protein